MHFRNSTRDFQGANAPRSAFSICAFASILVALTLQAQSTHTVSLAWDSSTNVAGYKMYYGVASRAYTNSINVGNVTTCSISNLVVGTRYYFAVTAYNSARVESDFSSEVAHTVLSNLPPTLTHITDRTINEDTATTAIPFTIGDAETAASNLALSGTSSNLTLVPRANIVFGGSGSNRTVRVTPAPNQFGTTAITISVSDGNLSRSRVFQLTVNPINDPPSIAPLADVVLSAYARSTFLSIITADIDTPAANLVLRGASSDTNVLPNANIVLGGTGFTRTLTLHPVTAGRATVTLTVSDGVAQTARSFLMTATNNPAIFKVRPLFTASNGRFTVTWESRTGATYRVLSKATLGQSNWVNVSGTVTATTATSSWADPTASRDTSRLYVVEMLTP